jgi:hypothetical protein
MSKTESNISNLSNPSLSLEETKADQTNIDSLMSQLTSQLKMSQNSSVIDKRKTENLRGESPLNKKSNKLPKIDLESLTKFLSMNNLDDTNKSGDINNKTNNIDKNTSNVQNLRNGDDNNTNTNNPNSSDNKQDNQDLIKQLMKKVEKKNHKEKKEISSNKEDKPYTMSLSEIEKQISLLKNLSLKENN